MTTTVLNLFKIKLFNFDLLLYCHFEFVAVWRVIKSAKLHFVFLNPISAGRNRVNPIPIDIGVPPPHLWFCPWSWERGVLYMSLVQLGLLIKKIRPLTEWLGCRGGFLNSSKVRRNFFSKKLFLHLKNYNIWHMLLYPFCKAFPIILVLAL